MLQARRRRRNNRPGQQTDGFLTNQYGMVGIEIRQKIVIMFINILVCVYMDNSSNVGGGVAAFRMTNDKCILW